MTTSPTQQEALVDDLDRLPFDNQFTRELPADPSTSNTRRQVQAAAYSRVAPTPTAGPVTLAWSPEVANLLGLDPALAQTSDFARVFGGSRVPTGADPFAMVYGGHQFGNWAGQLGDGRAIALGEVLDSNGQHQTLQLKGAGPTPYSRTADGRAVLRSSVREFLCSEAMHHLGIPTTRALSLVTTGDQVVRDMLYDGHPAPETGAVVCRVAPSFIRFGTFQLPSSRGDVATLAELVRYTISHDFPHLVPDGADLTDRGVLAGLVPTWLAEVAELTAKLVVHWMRVGFVHGVLNTDNLSILGLTIDYGPYGWLEGYDPEWTPNTTDAGSRRYRYGFQPRVAHWNLVQLANALVPLLDGPEGLQDAVDRFPHAYETGFQAMVAERLGWNGWQDDDGPLVEDLFETLQTTETDQVLFFRNLSKVPVPAPGDLPVADETLLEPFAESWYQPAEMVGEVRERFVTWLRAWSGRVAVGGLDDGERRKRMDAVNPRYVLRNYLAQEAIDLADAGDPSRVVELLDVLRTPYTDQPERDQFSARRPEWARERVGCSMLSCSS